ncbi:hypothetical protein B566_EDAN017170 [Ephemera danica]|nr:hypothetical protein B566_EDAN017170 [Ephemera danica]
MTSRNHCETVVINSFIGRHIIESVQRQSSNNATNIVPASAPPLRSWAEARGALQTRTRRSHKIHSSFNGNIGTVVYSDENAAAAVSAVFANNFERLTEWDISVQQIGFLLLPVVLANEAKKVRAAKGLLPADGACFMQQREEERIRMRTRPLDRILLQVHAVFHLLTQFCRKINEPNKKAVCECIWCRKQSKVLICGEDGLWNGENKYLPIDETCRKCRFSRQSKGTRIVGCDSEPFERNELCEASQPLEVNEDSKDSGSLSVAEEETSSNIDNTDRCDSDEETPNELYYDDIIESETTCPPNAEENDSHRKFEEASMTPVCVCGSQKMDAVWNNAIPVTYNSQLKQDEYKRRRIHFLGACDDVMSSGEFVIGKHMKVTVFVSYKGAEVFNRNPRDSQQITFLARQLCPANPKFIQQAYIDATSRHFGYLFLDLKQETPDELSVIFIWPMEVKKFLDLEGAENKKRKRRLTGEHLPDCETRDTRFKIVQAENVSYSPKFHGNVLSVPRMTSIGHKVVLTYERCYIYKENRELLATGTRQRNLYVLDTAEEKVFQVETRDKNKEHPHRDRDHRQSDKKMVKRTKEKSRDVPVKNKKNTALSGSYKIKRNEHERNAEQRLEKVGGIVKEENYTKSPHKEKQEFTTVE